MVELVCPRMANLLEWVMALLALAIVPTIILEDRAVDPFWRSVAVATNWFIWSAFVVEYVVRLARAESRKTFVRNSWFDLAIIALSPPFAVPESWHGIRVLRVLRLLRALAVTTIGLRHLRTALVRRRFHWLLAVTVTIVLLGAAGEFYFEGRGDGSIRSFPDSLWWAVVTATTVGYGDLSPVTVEGRLIAAVLMLTGIGVIGIFTANIASMFFEQDAKSELREVEARLLVIEQKLDKLLDGRS